MKAAILCAVFGAACAAVQPLAGLLPAAGPAQFDGVVALPRGPGLGGFSAIALDPDGAGFAALSDRNGLFRGTIARTPDGRPQAVAFGPALPLTGPGGGHADAEGLATAPDGTLFASFEGIQRVLALAPDGTHRFLPANPAFAALPRNGGLEALARDAAGRLYTLPEETPNPDGTLPLWRLGSSGWEHLRDLPGSPEFRPVGADFGPDGNFYLLERRFAGLAGFATRLRRFGPAGEGAGAVLLETLPGRHDNLEGLSVWRDGAGALRATMIADDNFFPAQRGEIVEYRLPEADATGGGPEAQDCPSCDDGDRPDPGTSRASAGLVHAAPAR